MENKFLLTTSATTAKTLINAGFTLVNQNGTQWLFINNPKVTFSNLEKVTYTNKMFF